MADDQKSFPDYKSWLQGIEDRQEGLESKFDSFASEVRRDIRDLASIVGDVSSSRGKVEGKTLALIMSAVIGTITLAATMGHTYLTQNLLRLEKADEAIIKLVDANIATNVHNSDRMLEMAEWRGIVGEKLRVLDPVPDRVTKAEKDVQYAWQALDHHKNNVDHPLVVTEKLDTIIKRISELEKKAERFSLD